MAGRLVLQESDNNVDDRDGFRLGGFFGAFVVVEFLRVL